MNSLSVIVPSIIASIAVIIASQQWFTSRDQLKHQLFDRRIIVYQSITSFIATTLVGEQSDVEKERVKFLKTTKDVYFLFGDDIKCFVEDIRSKTNDLGAYTRELQGSVSDEDRKTYIKKIRELTDWLEFTLNTIEPRFVKYLRLKH